jgi:hypothetical protein
MVIYYTNTWNVSRSWSRTQSSLFVFIQYSSVFSFSNAFYIDFLFKRIYISAIRRFRFTVPTQSNCIGYNWPSSFDRFKCVGESHIKPGGESRLENVCDQDLIVFVQIGGLIAHVVLFWGRYGLDCFKDAYNKERLDPHYRVSIAPL